MNGNSFFYLLDGVFFAAALISLVILIVFLLSKKQKTLRKTVVHILPVVIFTALYIWFITPFGVNIDDDASISVNYEHTYLELDEEGRQEIMDILEKVSVKRELHIGGYLAQESIDITVIEDNPWSDETAKFRRFLFLSEDMDESMYSPITNSWISILNTEEVWDELLAVCEKYYITKT